MMEKSGNVKQTLWSVVWYPPTHETNHNLILLLEYRRLLELERAMSIVFKIVHEQKYNKRETKN